MTEDGFIRQLEETLQGEVSDAQLNETLAYYRSYINEQMGAGLTEEEILASLGSPRLIARSVIDAYGADRIGIHEGEFVQEEEGDPGNPDGRNRRYGRSGNMSVTANKIVAWLVLAGIIILVCLLLRFLLPVLLIGFVIWTFFRMLNQ